jgi:probable O-glycosylation ligase (exosortase A-associated)
MALRDLVLTLLLVGALPVALRWPFVGICVYAWLGLMNPHRLSWSFAYDMPWAQVYGIVALVSLAWERDRQLGPAIGRFWLVIVYLLWMGITTAFALEPDRAQVRIVEVFKIYLMAIVTLAVLTSEQRIRAFLAVAVLSVAFFGIKGGVFTLASGGAFRVWGPPGSVIEDNNQLAVALTMTVPLMVWLARFDSRRWVRLGLYGAIALVVASILGSHSRGAMVAIVAMSALLVLKSERKVLFSVVFAMGAGLALALMPDHFWARMSSILNYEQDASVQGRFNAWATAIRIADARPTGGGFDYTGARSFAAWAPDPANVKSSHSIYFQALGEHGWPGLVLFLGFWLLVWMACRRALRRWQKDPERSHLASLAAMLQVSLIGYLAGGAFVNIGYWDFPFYLAAVAFALVALGAREAASAAPRAGSISAAARGGRAGLAPHPASAPPVRRSAATSARPEPGGSGVRPAGASRG